MKDAILSIRGLRKSYASGTEALKEVNLDIRRGEIFALLGPNGAGKTTLINIVCGIVTPSGGTVLVDGKDHLTDYRHARTRIGLVPQELTTDAFESVWRNSTTEFWIGFKLWGMLPLTFLFAAANVPMLLRHGLASDEALPAEPGPIE